MIILVIIIGILAFIFNMVASFAIIRSRTHSNMQRIWQAFFVWVIPFIGAALIWHIHNETLHAKSPGKKINPHDDSSWDTVPPAAHHDNSEADDDL